MYYCQNCDNTFEQDEIKTIHFSYTLFNGFEESEAKDICPYCGSDDIWEKDFDEDDKEEQDND